MTHGHADPRPVICLVCGDAGRHGCGQHLVELASHLDRERWELHVVTLGPPGPLVARIEGLSVPVHTLDVEAGSGWSRSWWSFVAFLNLFLVLRELRPRLVHTLDQRSATAGRLAARLAGVPWVVASHRAPVRDRGVGPLLARATSWLVDVHVATGRSLASEACSRQGVHVRRLRIIPEGVSPGRVAGARAAEDLGGGKPVIGCLGGLSEAKGADTLLEAAAILLRYHPELRVVLAGPSPDPLPYLRRARHLEIEDRVTFPGVREDVGAVLAALDVCVIPSRREGTPLLLLEALAAGVPVVAARLPGIMEVVRDGVHALLVEPGHPALLADAVDRLLVDRRLAASLVQAAAGRARAHLACTMAGRYQELYEELR